MAATAGNPHRTDTAGRRWVSDFGKLLTAGVIIGVSHIVGSVAALWLVVKHMRAPTYHGDVHMGDQTNVSSYSDKSDRSQRHGGNLGWILVLVVAIVAWSIWFSRTGRVVPFVPEPEQVLEVEE